MHIHDHHGLCTLFLQLVVLTATLALGVILFNDHCGYKFAEAIEKRRVMLQSTFLYMINNAFVCLSRICCIVFTTSSHTSLHLKIYIHDITLANTYVDSKSIS